jgi:hypothetical protein
MIMSLACTQAPELLASGLPGSVAELSDTRSANAKVNTSALEV